MNYASIAHVFGKLLVVTGSSMVLPMICSIYYGEDDLVSIGISAVIILAIGWPLWRFFRRTTN
jgi:trk system potassium uptake protein TrkH